MEQKQQQAQSYKAAETKKDKARNNSVDEKQQSQQQSQTNEDQIKNISLEHTLKEILGVKNKPTANQSALFDRLVFELSSVASLTNNPNTISYSRDKSITTDSTISNGKLFLSGGILSQGSMAGGAELSHDTEGQGNSSSSSYEDCSSSACSCQDCIEKEGTNRMPLSLIQDQEGQLEQTLKLEEIPDENFCNLTDEIDSEDVNLNENDQKINEMNDEVFNELVAYSYLAGLATAQLQKDEGEDLPAEVDLNDTQFIERSLLQYEKWQQSFLNNTLVHDNTIHSNIEEIPQEKVQSQNTKSGTSFKNKPEKNFSLQSVPQETNSKKFIDDKNNLKEMDSIVYQEYYKKIQENKGKKGYEQYILPISRRTMPKEKREDKIGERLTEYEQKQHQLQLGEQLFDMFAKSRAEYLANLGKQVKKDSLLSNTNESDSADEPLPPVTKVTRDCFVQDQLGGSKQSADADHSMTRHVVQEASNERLIKEKKEPVAPRNVFSGMNDDELYQLAEFDDCEGIQSSHTGYPFNFTKQQWLKADKKINQSKTSDQELSFDLLGVNQSSKNDDIAQNLSASNFVSGKNQDDEIRDLVRDLQEEHKKADQLLDELDQNIFSPTDFDEEGAAQLLADLSEEEHELLMKDSKPEPKPQKKQCDCDDHDSSQDQEKLFMDRKDLKMMLDVERNLYKMLQYSSEDDQQAAKADSEGDDEPYAPNSYDIDIISGLSLKQLETFMIQGDMRRCVVCNLNYAKKDKDHRGNLPRVLFCGDSICEQCIIKHTQKASIIQDKRINGAACQLICPVCNFKHIFKLTKAGFVVGNDNYIKFLDDRGPVNFFPGSKINEEMSIKMLTDNLKDNDGQLMLMDHSISIPSNLILRSLPINCELLELLDKERECGEPNQSQSKLRGLYHLVIDGTKNTSKSQNSPSATAERIIDFAKPQSDQEQEPILKDNNKRDLKESAKQLKKLNIQNLQHSQPDEEIKLDEEECAPPLVNTILQRKDDDDDLIMSLQSSTPGGLEVGITAEQKNAALQSIIQSLTGPETGKPTVVTNLADWFLQSKHAILNKGSIKEAYSSDSDDSHTSNEDIGVADSEHNVMPGKRKKNNHLQYKVYLGSSNSSKSTFKHTGNHHINSQGGSSSVQCGNLSPKGAETLLSNSICSSLQQQNLDSKNQSIAQINRKRKLRERRKLRQLYQQHSQQSSIKKIKYSGPLFGPIDSDLASNASAFFIDNRGGEMSPDSGDDTMEFPYDQSLIKNEREIVTESGEDKEDQRSDGKNVFIGPLQAVQHSTQLNLMGEGEQRSTSPNPREPKSSALPIDVLPPALIQSNKPCAKQVESDQSIASKIGFAIQTSLDTDSPLKKEVAIKTLLTQHLKSEIPFPLEEPFPIEALDFIQKKESDKEFSDIIKQYFNIKQNDSNEKADISAVDSKPNFAPTVSKEWKDDLLENQPSDALSDSASKKKARRNKKKRKKQQMLVQQQHAKQEQLISALQQQGQQIAEDNSKDMLTELVLIGEETIEGDELRYRTVYKDFFNYRPLDAQCCATEVQISINFNPNSEEKKLNQNELQNTVEEEVKEGDNLVDLQDLKLSLTCISCCNGAPTLSSYTPQISSSTDGTKSIVFGKQDLNLIKDMIEVGITTVSTHICIHCSVNRQQSDFWNCVDHDWIDKASQPFGCALCLVCSIKHKQQHSKITSAAKFMHEQNEDTGLNFKQVLDEGLEQEHQMKPLLPSSYFQLLQKRDLKKVHFSNLIDSSIRSYLNQATNEEYILYLTQVMNKLKICKDDKTTFIGGQYLETNLQPKQIIQEPEKQKDITATKKDKQNKNKKASRKNNKK